VEIEAETTDAAKAAVLAERGNSIGLSAGDYYTPGPDEEIEVFPAKPEFLPVTFLPFQARPANDDHLGADNDRFPVLDWKYEVANGDTRLGYAEWLAKNLEQWEHEEAEAEKIARAAGWIAEREYNGEDD